MTLTETKMFLCTANVGTVFEQLDEMMVPYVDQIANKIDELKPEFVAIHMQEMGGKHYKTAMQSVDRFFKHFLSNRIVKEYNRYLIVTDSDFTDDLSFTSLCNVYLIHQSLPEECLEIFNFKEEKFYKFLTRQIYTGNLADNEFIYKERFVKKFFPEFKWSRKGFLQTKWRIRNKIVNLVNVHLFHDACNLTALNGSPSIYSQNRRNALKYILDKVNKNVTEFEVDHYTAYFGDFNFRLDLGPLVDKYTSKSKNNGIKESEESTSKIFRDNCERDIFVIADKKFKWNNNSHINDEVNILRDFDKEMSLLDEDLYEFTRSFPPSYPFMEDLVNHLKYMETRCPAWCDRVVFNKQLHNLLINEPNCQYDMIGLQAPMGDHKPIYLFFKFTSENFQSSENPTVDANNNLDSTTVNINSEKSQNFKDIDNYVYINHNLANLANSIIDMHDNAWFTQISPLNFLKDEGHFTYANYTLMNLGENFVGTRHPPNITQSDIFEQKDITLNQWFKAIGELIINIHRNPDNQITREDNTSVNICYKMNQHDKNINPPNECQCIEKFCHPTHSYLVSFFINSLNGNFFKLKHLMAYLNDQIVSLKNDLNNRHVLAADNSIDYLMFTSHNLFLPLDATPMSLMILTEIRTFLNSTCVWNVFRKALKNSVVQKKLSIYFNFYTNKNFKINGGGH